MIRSLTPVLVAAALMGGCADKPQGGGAPPTAAGIPLAAFGTVRDWRPDGSGGIYVESENRAWYHATFTAPCTGLLFALHLDVRTVPPFPIDRFDSIQIHDQICYFKTFDPAADAPDQPPPARTVR